jgi:hypothetical protein
VVSVTEKMVAVQKENGEVDIVAVIFDEEGKIKLWRIKMNEMKDFEMKDLKEVVDSLMDNKVAGIVVVSVMAILAIS